MSGPVGGEADGEVESELIELAVHTTLFIGLGRFNEVIGLDPA